ncbi:hypothetical protein ACQB6R_05095 [Propionibacteriaceae bacterium G1746]|uniref:hypothetical protein n=1 Tax=Aestuariimicrobium sp. G57 TaxID=3418485 RepID=UPI003C154DCA
MDKRMPERGEHFTIDCQTCTVAGPGCADCIVGLLLGRSDEVWSTTDDLSADEQRVVDMFARADMLPPRGEARLTVRWRGVG